MKKKIFLSIAVLVVIGVSWVAVQTSRAGHESAEYEVIDTDGDFELRTYPDLVTVSTPTAEGKDRNSGFGKLFKFITGNNENAQKIAMTTPVFMPSDDEAESKEMHFVMPKEVASAGVPVPKGKNVSVKTITGGKFATLRFSGYRSVKKQKEALANLREIITERALEADGAPMFAYYDPPWIPEGLRRNEVLLRLK